MRLPTLLASAKSGEVFYAFGTCTTLEASPRSFVVEHGSSSDAARLVFDGAGPCSGRSSTPMSDPYVMEHRTGAARLEIVLERENDTYPAAHRARSDGLVEADARSLRAVAARSSLAEASPRTGAQPLRCPAMGGVLARTHMRSWAGVFGILVLVGCSRAESKTDPAPTRPGVAPAVASAGTGAPGAGNRSGSSIANARALAVGTPATFTVPCTGESVYVGPFTLKHDPERLVVRASVKGTTTAQVCVSDGHWVDGRGDHPMIAGLPCVEGGKPVEAKLEYEYSPGNGGNNVSAVYWRVRHTNPKPAGCDTVAVTLSFP